MSRNQLLLASLVLIISVLLPFALLRVATRSQVVNKYGPTVEGGTEAQVAQEAWAKQCGVEVSTKNSLGANLILIPPGEFVMGSPKKETSYWTGEDQHSVKLSKGFWLGETEVTQREWVAIMDDNPSHFKVMNNHDTSRFPVEMVTWYDVVEFCNKLSEKEQLAAYYELRATKRQDGHLVSAEVAIVGGRGYRLPTEAEWEYACRAGTITAYHYGNKLNSQQANVGRADPSRKLPNEPYLSRPTTVKSYAPNGFGLYDMHGNVLEWCFDWEGSYDASPGVHLDPSSPQPGRMRINPNARVVRGGCWSNLPTYARSASRNFSRSGGRTSGTGFRVARTMEYLRELIPRRA